MSEFDAVLPECLAYCGISELPPAIDIDCKMLWVKAIAIVHKSNGRRSLAVMFRNERFESYFVKSFGSTAAIVRVESIHPYKRVPAHLLPRMWNPEGIFKYLLHYGCDKREIEPLFTVDDNGEWSYKDREAVFRKLLKIAYGLMKQEEKELQKYVRNVEHQKQREQQRRVQGRKPRAHK